MAVLTKCLNHQEPLVTVKVRLQVVLENLVSNALKYNSEERDKTEITIETRCAEHRFLISVSDNGMGIPERCHSKVFQAFQRFSNSDKPGSGLGLAKVMKNIKQLGGETEITGEVLSS